MSEEVTVREDLQVIQVLSHGDVTLEDFKASLDAVLRIQESRRLKRVFVDGTSAKSYPSVFPVFDFGSQAAQALRGTKVAIVLNPENREQSRFFETVARNRGGDFKVFDKPDTALTWLTE